MSRFYVLWWGGMGMSYEFHYTTKEISWYGKEPA